MIPSEIIIFHQNLFLKFQTGFAGFTNPSRGVVTVYAE